LYIIFNFLKDRFSANCGLHTIGKEFLTTKFGNQYFKGNKTGFLLNLRKNRTPSKSERPKHPISAANENGLLNLNIAYNKEACSNH